MSLVEDVAEATTSAAPEQFVTGSKVRFKAGPRSIAFSTGVVTGKEGQFLVVGCEDGKSRKIRPGACTANV